MEKKGRSSTEQQVLNHCYKLLDKWLEEFTKDSGFYMLPSQERFRVLLDRLDLELTKVKNRPNSSWNKYKINTMQVMRNQIVKDMVLWALQDK